MNLHFSRQLPPHGVHSIARPPVAKAGAGAPPSGSSMTPSASPPSFANAIGGVPTVPPVEVAPQTEQPAPLPAMKGWAQIA